MKKLVLLLILLTTISAHALELERGVEVGASCEQIVAAETRLGSEVVGSGVPPVIGFLTKYRDFDAAVIYRCTPGRWSQAIEFGRFDRERANAELSTLTEELRRRYGEPETDGAALTWLERLVAFWEVYFENPDFYHEFISHKEWYYEGPKITAHIQRSPGLLDRAGRTWFVSYRVDTRK